MEYHILNDFRTSTSKKDPLISLLNNLILRNWVVVCHCEEIQINTVFNPMSARGAHLTLGARGEALIRGTEGWGKQRALQR